MVGDDDARRLAEVIQEVEIMKRTYFVTCPFCGSNLDPGERCDCNEGRSYHDEKIQGLQNEGQLLSLEAEERRERLSIRRHGTTLQVRRRSTKVY